jgi:hypothetical protein
MEYKKSIKATLELVCVLYYGLFGIYVMIMTLIKKVFHHLCRLYLWLPIRSFVILLVVGGHDMDIGCNRSAMVASDLYSQCGWRFEKAIDFIMIFGCSSLVLFRWLIHLETLCDPWFVIIVKKLLSKSNKERMHRSMQRLGHVLFEVRDREWHWG